MSTREWLYRAYNIDKEIKEIEEAYNSAVADVLYTSPQFELTVCKKARAMRQSKRLNGLLYEKNNT